MKTHTESELKQLIEEAFPGAVVRIDHATQKGFWIDVLRAGVRATVEYRIGQGFGVSAIGEETAFGEGPDGVCGSPEEMVAQLREILGTKTKPA